MAAVLSLARRVTSDAIGSKEVDVLETGWQAPTLCECKQGPIEQAYCMTRGQSTHPFEA